MNNSIKKQSIPQVCTWGMGFLDTPINKMGVTEFESMHSHLQDADLPLPFERPFAVPHLHMVMTEWGYRSAKVAEYCDSLKQENDIMRDMGIE